MAEPTRERWATGDRSGLRFPADAATLLDAGAQFLTRAFRDQHALAQKDSVVRIARSEDVDGGSTGRKLLLSVDYDTPTPPRELFVKFSRDFDDVGRDHGRSQLEAEVEVAILAATAHFPVAIPAVMFGDFERSSGTGILITERIVFGHNGIDGSVASMASSPNTPSAWTTACRINWVTTGRSSGRSRAWRAWTRPVRCPTH